MLVSAIGCIRLYRFGLLTWRSAYPFAVLGLPLIARRRATSPQRATNRRRRIAAGRRSANGTLSLATKPLDCSAPDFPPYLGSLLVGGLTGLVSDMTGVVGGIFLATLVLSLAWATRRQTAAISVCRVQPHELDGCACREIGNDAIVAYRLPAWLVGVGFGGPLLMDGRAAPQRTTLQLLAFLLVAAAGQ